MKKPLKVAILIGIILIILILLFSKSRNTQTKQENTETMMKVISVFNNNEKIPEKYTCDGENINPPLEILNIPENAKSLVLIMDDPDAPSETFDHWILFNIPIIKRIEENSVPDDSIQGWNSLNKNSYSGPCPPSGTHHYSFRLYALDSPLKIKQSSTKAIVENAMQSHVLEKAELVGIYSRES